MKIKNISGGTVTISDLPGPQQGGGLTLQTGAEIVIYDEDAEKSSQLAGLMTAGVISKLSDEEPGDSGPAADADVAAAVAGSNGIRSATTVVNTSGQVAPSAGQVLIADSDVAASWGALPPAAPAVHILGGAQHNPDTLANLNTKVSDATLIDTADARLSDARTPVAHGLGGAEHNTDTLANLNAKVSDATLVDTGDARFSDARQCDNSFANAATSRTNLGVYSTSQVDAKVVGLYDHKGAYDAATNSPDLDTTPSGIKKGDAYTVSVAGNFFAEAVEVGDVLIADQDDPTLLTHWTRVNKNISFGTSAGTACEGDDSRLSDARTPTAHLLGSHTTDTLANLNAKVTDATLIDTADARLSDARTPIAHTIGGAEHSAGTLASLNAKVSDATLIDTADSRLSDDRTASGLRSATTVVSISGATAPTTGQILIAVDGTSATWQTDPKAAKAATIVTADTAASGALTSSQEATADASVQTGAYVQVDVESIRTLANALKASYNQAQVDIAALKTAHDGYITLINEMKAKLNTMNA